MLFAKLDIYTHTLIVDQLIFSDFNQIEKTDKQYTYKSRIHKRQPHPLTIQEMFDAISKEWENFATQKNTKLRLIACPN